MTTQQMFNPAVIQRIVDRHDRTTGIAEYLVYPLCTQRLNYPLSTIHGYFPALLREAQDFILLVILCSLFTFSWHKKTPGPFGCGGYLAIPACFLSLSSSKCSPARWDNNHHHANHDQANH
ncbi:hypothetical protein D3C76_1389440 [compost metagenome]